MSYILRQKAKKSLRVTPSMPTILSIVRSSRSQRVLLIVRQPLSANSLRESSTKESHNRQEYLEDFSGQRRCRLGAGNVKENNHGGWWNLVGVEVLRRGGGELTGGGDPALPSCFQPGAQATHVSGARNTSAFAKFLGG